MWAFVDLIVQLNDKDFVCELTILKGSKKPGVSPLGEVRGNKFGLGGSDEESKFYRLVKDVVFFANFA